MSDESQFTADEVRALKSLARLMLGGGAAAAGGGAAGGRVASARELAGKYGDPSVRKDPRNWVGPSFVGARFSQCPSEYLELIAEFKDWCADKDQTKPESEQRKVGTKNKPAWEYDRLDAALARGWAERNRGKKLLPPAPAPASDFGGDPGDAPVGDFASGGDDDIPF